MSLLVKAAQGRIVADITPASIDAAWAQENPAAAEANELQHWRSQHGGR